jgi:hypothetical protein
MVPDTLSEIEALLAGIREEAMASGPILDRC